MLEWVAVSSSRGSSSAASVKVGGETGQREEQAESCHLMIIPTPQLEGDVTKSSMVKDESRVGLLVSQLETRPETKSTA